MRSTNPIPRNIRRIRASRGFSQEETATRAGISRNAFRCIETGQSEPRVNNLRKIAHALGVDLSALLSEPSRLASVRFRSQKPRSGHVQATRDQVVVDVARWLKDFNALEELLDHKKHYGLEGLSDRISKTSDAHLPMEAARLAREAMGLQPDEAIRDICGLLESAGIKVRVLDLPMENLFGLSVAAGDGGPGIVVNVREDISVERRIFTAAHELGHLLLHPNAFDIEKIAEDDEEEKQADAFASHFLMPKEVFLREWRNTYGLPFVDRVLHVKRMFRVSYQTVLFRLVEEEVVDAKKVWMIFKAQWKRRSGKALTKKVEPMPLAEVDFLEDRLSRLVRQAVESEKITLSRGAEILNLDLDTMRDVVASWNVAA